MMGGGFGCVDEKHITFDDRKKNALHFTRGWWWEWWWGCRWCNQLKLWGLGSTPRAAAED